MSNDAGVTAFWDAFMALFGTVCLFSSFKREDKIFHLCGTMETIDTSFVSHFDETTGCLKGRPFDRIGGIW